MHRHQHRQTHRACRGDLFFLFLSTTQIYDPTNSGSRASRRQSVMWDSVFEATPASKHVCYLVEIFFVLMPLSSSSFQLPEVKSWQDFFKLCKLTPEQVAEYSNRFEEEGSQKEMLFCFVILRKSYHSSRTRTTWRSQSKSPQRL